MTRALTCAASFFAAVLAVAPAMALDQATSVSSVVRESFAVRAFEDITLPQSSVRAVHVGRRGFLWVGTREGLVRYRAGQQKVWQQTSLDEDGLPSGMINTIYEDDAGTIIVATGRGVARQVMGSDSFRALTFADGTAYTSDVVAIDVVAGTLLAVAASGDVFKIIDDTLLPVDIVGDTIFTGARAIRSQQVTDATTHKDELIMATTGDGVIRLRLHDDDTLSKIKSYASGSVVVNVTTDGKNLIWLDRDSGMHWESLSASMDDTANTRGFSDPLANNPQGYYRAMAASSADSAWFGAGPNIVRLRGGDADVVRLPGRGNEVRSITVDRVGNVWIGGYYGLYYGVDTEFDTLQTAAAFDSGMVTVMAHADDTLYLAGQNIWVGKTGSSEYRELQSVYDNEKISGLRLNPLSVGNDPVTAMVADSDLLMVGYYVGGLDVVDLTNGAVTNVTEVWDAQTQEFTPLDNIGVSALVRVDENRWLASCYLYGLVEITVNRGTGAPAVSTRRLSQHNALIGLYALSPTRFLVVDQGNLILAEANAAGELSLTAFDRTPPGIVFAVHPDGEGGAYLGLESDGVWHIDSSAMGDARLDYTRLDVVDRLLGQRTVWHLALDDNGTLWATTNNGVYLLDLTANALVSHITYRDGLPSNEFEYGPNASLRLPSGEKIFASANGPVTFTKPVEPMRKPITLLWDDVTINGESIMAELGIAGKSEAEVTLPYEAVSKGVARFEYGFDNHVQALNTRYVIRMDGRGDWLPSGLPAVSVTGRPNWDPVLLEFGLLDSSGTLVSEPLQVTLSVTPPWYMLWFIDLRIALPVLFMMAALTITLQRRATQRQEIAVADALKKREIEDAEMRGRLSEKEILLREIHHRVGNILSNFAANVRSMKRSAKSDETRDTLEHLNARIKVQSAVHMLLQRSDSTDINVANMLRQVAAGARDFMGGGMTLSGSGAKTQEIDLLLDDIWMTYSKAQYLGLITNELLTNTYKHTQAGEGVFASVTWRLQSDGSARFHYRDYGEGVPNEARETALAKHLRSSGGGLQQVVEMARELKGDPEIYNENGMHLRFTIPPKLLRNPIQPSEEAPAGELQS